MCSSPFLQLPFCEQAGAEPPAEGVAEDPRSGADAREQDLVDLAEKWKAGKYFENFKAIS